MSGLSDELQRIHNRMKGVSECEVLEANFTLSEA